MLSRFLPKETSFFDYFEEHCALTLEACQEMAAMTEPGANIASRAARIAELEHEGDTLTHRCLKALQKTFITPFDRSHIHNLISSLDDILDAVDEACSRIVLYEILELRPEIKAQAQALTQGVRSLGEALKGLRNMKDTVAVKKMCIAVHRAENEADGILRGAISRLFKEETQPLIVIKWKEIFELLEEAADRCEDAADTIQGIMIEAS